MSQTSALEERLAPIEVQVADLRSQVENLRSKGSWIDEITGSFKDDPEFDEILRLGREIRQTDRLESE